MPYSATILVDSLAPNGQRLTTFELVFPRCILAEFNTHRKVSGGDPDYVDFVGSVSSNAASSRAIPVLKMIKRIEDDPYIPETWGENQRGMGMGEPLPPGDEVLARRDYLYALDCSVGYARSLAKLNVHKEIVNRILEPFAWTKVVASATTWAGFYAQRTAPYASPALRKLAVMMLELYQAATPQSVPAGYDHLPYTTTEDRYSFSPAKLRAISTARCARTSYLTQSGIHSPEEDLALFERLVSAGHWSPTEHVATAQGETATPSGNFMGWNQYRKVFPGEHIDRLPVIQPDGSIHY